MDVYNMNNYEENNNYYKENKKVIDGKWKHDSDIPLRIWNGYLKKYGKYH